MTSPRQRKKKAAILKLREKQKQQNKVVEPVVITTPPPTLAEKLAEQKPKEKPKTTPAPKVKKEALRELSQMTQEFGGYETEEKVVPTKSSVVDTPQQKTEETKDEV